jgi:hypothetical protein
VSRSPWLAGILVLTGALAFASCDDSPESLTAPSSIASATPLAAELRAALERSIQDEYRAETIYQGVVADFGALTPFVNVIGAEQRHSSAIALMFTRRSLPVPANAWTVATVPHFATVPSACAAAAIAERENMALYDELLRLDLPSDVRQVFESNRTASLVAHLPAFERCS